MQTHLGNFARPTLGNHERPEVLLVTSPTSKHRNLHTATHPTRMGLQAKLPITPKNNFLKNSKNYIHSHYSQQHIVGVAQAAENPTHPTIKTNPTNQGSVASLHISTQPIKFGPGVLQVGHKNASHQITYPLSLD